MVTATFDEKKYCVVPVEPTEEQYLNLALQREWVFDDDEGSCTERDWAIEGYSEFINGIKKEQLMGVVIEKDVNINIDVKTQLNTLNILYELSNHLGQESLSSEDLEKLFNLINTGIKISEACEIIIKDHSSFEKENYF